MINIAENETKLVYLTLNEKVTIENPYFVFKITDQQTLSETIFTQEDTSTDEDFNIFSFTNGSTFSYNGGFTLSRGSYDYTVYESENNDLSTDGGVVEIGQMNISGSFDSESYNYNSTNNKYEY